VVLLPNVHFVMLLAITECDRQMDLYLRAHGC